MYYHPPEKKGKYCSLTWIMQNFDRDLIIWPQGLPWISKHTSMKGTVAWAFWTPFYINESLVGAYRLNNFWVCFHNLRRSLNLIVVHRIRYLRGLRTPLSLGFDSKKPKQDRKCPLHVSTWSWPCHHVSWPCIFKYLPRPFQSSVLRTVENLPYPGAYPHLLSTRHPFKSAQCEDCRVDQSSLPPPRHLEGWTVNWEREERVGHYVY
jgi:hypothetical protein